VSFVCRQCDLRWSITGEPQSRLDMPDWSAEATARFADGAKRKGNDNPDRSTPCVMGQRRIGAGHGRQQSDPISAVARLLPARSVCNGPGCTAARMTTTPAQPLHAAAPYRRVVSARADRCRNLSHEHRHVLLLASPREIRLRNDANALLVIVHHEPATDLMELHCGDHVGDRGI
jgi:hypothetical protein